MSICQGFFDLGSLTEGTESAERKDLPDFSPQEIKQNPQSAAGGVFMILVMPSLSRASLKFINNPSCLLDERINRPTLGVID